MVHLINTRLISYRDHFVVDDSVFSKIGLISSNTISDLGYRKVPCDVGSSNIKAKVSFLSSDVYFSVLLFNTRIGLSHVTVKSNLWAAPEPLFHQSNGGALWQWNKISYNLNFPAVFSLHAINGEVVSYTMRKFQPSVVIDLGVQFSSVYSGPSCSMALAPASVLQGEKLGFGWQIPYSDEFTQLNASQVNASENEIRLNFKGAGRFQITRDNGINTKFFGAFSMKAITPHSQTAQQFSVYFVQVGGEESQRISIYVSGVWEGYSISFNSSGLELPSQRPPEKYLTIQNNAAHEVEVWIRDMQFIEIPHEEFQEEFPNSTADSTNSTVESNITYTVPIVRGQSTEVSSASLLSVQLYFICLAVMLIVHSVDFHFD